MSVFHRVDDVHEMCSSVFFSRAQRLPYYDGAVRGRMLIEAGDGEGTASAQPAKDNNVKVVPSDRAALAFNFPEMSVRTVKKAG